MIPKSGHRFSDEIMRRKEGAKRRNAHPTNVRASADKPAQFALLISRRGGALFRGAPALRRFTAALASAVATTSGSALDPRFLDSAGLGVLPAFEPAQCCELLAGRAVSQGRPGTECKSPRAGTAPAPSFRLAFRKGALG